MNWLDIFCFTSVARTESFSVAAREMHISQQAVSSHIRKLEAEVGFPLFLRSDQNIRLTHAGKAILAYFTEREKLVSQLSRALHPWDDETVLRIGWSQWLRCPEWFRQAIQTFEKTHPGVQVLISDLDMWELDSALQNDDIDLLLTTNYVCSRLPVAWGSKVLTEVPLILLGSRNISYDMDNLGAYPYIASYAWEADEKGVYARVMRECGGLGFRPGRVMVFPDMGSVSLNILLKGGLTLGVEIAPLAESDSFVFLPTERTATAVLCRPNDRLNTLAAQFEACLASCMEVSP